MRLSGVPCQVCRYVVPGRFSQSSGMWSLEMTRSAASSAAMHSGLPNSIVATPAGNEAWVCGADSQVCVASAPRRTQLLVERARAVGEVAAEGDVDDVGVTGFLPWGARRASTGSSRSASSRQEPTTVSAPASRRAAARSARSAGGTNSRLPTVGQPARTADSVPATESSTARPAAGSMPSCAQACR